ncbi:MAG: glycoside hydrolase family 2 TIM barrel-domain containing protein [Paludibacter sp.]|nr:glycoside hydrolase family 2 TIM barrel-domain containing protein [Paludibacter sp.]
MFKLKYFSIPFCLLLLFSTTIQAQKEAGNSRTILNFDTDWRFLKGDAPGAENPEFDDSKWRVLDVPHDWSIEGTYDQANPTGRGGGYLPAGIGWYRKYFTVKAADSNSKFFIEFDGVMANSDIWINGFHLGKRPNGTISFSYNLTGHLKFGKGERNVLSVKADNSLQPAARYYTGAGIYRHVRLVKTNSLHIVQWGVFISTAKVTAKNATVNLQTTVSNDTKTSGSIVLETSIIDPAGKKVKSIESKQNIPSGKSITINQILEVTDPHLWDVNQPNLYRAISKIKTAKNILDEQTNTFGIRDSKFQAATGYWLNGKNIKIKGVCLHHDAGAVGAAVPESVWERRLALLKEAGVNAIRTAHDPVAPEFLDICDRLGFLVMDETFDTWTVAKPYGEKGYNLYFNQWWEKDTRDIVLRDRNHPSIIIYSVGNEIRDNLNDSSGFKKYKDQQDLVHRLDLGRPVTMALFRPGSSKVYTNGFTEIMDVVGQNYREKELVEAHVSNPGRIVIGTENGHEQSEWLVLRDNPFMAGQFLWTGFDYLGEAQWPAISRNTGLFDRTGSWSQQGYQRQSWWSEKPVVHMVRRSDNNGEGKWAANWTPLDFGTYDEAKVEVYSNCNDVELFLNDKSLGVKQKPANDAPRAWDISFEKGTLKAIGRNAGKVVATDEFKTAGDPVSIILVADKDRLTKDWNDVIYVTAKIVDSNGIVCPNADKLITFNVSDAGEIIAVDNGNVDSHESYRGLARRAFNGQCIAIIRGKSNSGQIKVSANSTELKAGSVTIDIK